MRNAPKAFEAYLNSKAGIKYFGEVPDALEYMSGYAIMVVPLLSGSGMRVKIIEAMAAGKTIISTTIGAEGNEGKHNQHFLIANTVHDFAKHVLLAMNSKKRCNSIGNNARNLVLKKFDTFAVAKELKDFYLARQKMK